MIENIVRFILVGAWIIAMIAAGIYAIAVFFTILSVVDGLGVFLCCIVFFVFVCIIIANVKACKE